MPLVSQLPRAKGPNPEDLEERTPVRTILAVGISARLLIVSDELRQLRKSLAEGSGSKP
jgi:hypothetical protein